MNMYYISSSVDVYKGRLKPLIRNYTTEQIKSQCTNNKITHDLAEYLKSSSLEHSLRKLACEML